MDDNNERRQDVDRRAMYEAWEDALSDVRRLEAELARMGGSAGDGGPPPKEMLEELSRLRRIADARLNGVIGLLHSDPHATAPAPLDEPPLD